MNEEMKLVKKVAEIYVQRQQKKVFNVRIDSFRVEDMVVYDPHSDSDSRAILRVKLNIKVLPEGETQQSKLEATLMIPYSMDGKFRLLEPELLRVCFSFMDELYRTFGYFDFKDFKKALDHGLTSWLSVASSHLKSEVDKALTRHYPVTGQSTASLKEVIDNEFKKDQFRASLVCHSFDPQFAKNAFVEKKVALDVHAERYIEARVASMRRALAQ